jgi:ribose transport system ATP-binding protein
MNNIIAQLKNVNIYYSKVKALDNLSIDFQSGSIHAIIGEHGAGKSSIGLSLCGLQKIGSGSIVIGSHSYSSVKTKIAKDKKVSIVHQQLLLNPYFSIAENLTFCDNSTPFFSFRLKRKMEEGAKKYVNSLGFDIDISRITKDLTLSEKALIAILARIKNNPKILILDESLDQISSEYYLRLKTILIKLKNDGCCIIITTHKIDWVYDIADIVSVIRSGRNILTENISGIDKMQIIKIAYTQFSETPVYHPNERSIYHLIKSFFLSPTHTPSISIFISFLQMC